MGGASCFPGSEEELKRCLRRTVEQVQSLFLPSFQDADALTRPLESDIETWIKM